MGDIIITREAPMGEVCMVPKNLECCLGQRMVLLKVDPAVCDNRFLLYSLMSQAVQHQIQWSQGTGTTVSNLRIPHLENLNIPYIPLEQQRAIAITLSCLDDKIELNNKINANLEAQAQAIFKSWFVDFGPFQDGEFVDSELGPIPKGWQIGTFSDLIDRVIAGDWGKEFETRNYTKEVYCIRGADIPSIEEGHKGKMPLRFILPKNYEKKKIQSGDLVVEISGGSPTQSTGRIVEMTDSLLHRYELDMICTNFCKAISVKKDYSRFAYRYWKHFYKQNVMFSYENGTTGIKNFAFSDFIETHLLVIPPQKDVIRFNMVTNALSNTIYQNGIQSESLAALRDALLPKLMSGEIEVPIPETI